MVKGQSESISGQLDDLSEHLLVLYDVLSIVVNSAHLNMAPRKLMRTLIRTFDSLGSICVCVITLCGGTVENVGLGIINSPHTQKKNPHC